MYGTNDYARLNSRWNRRTWLVAGTAVAAVVALLLFVVVVANSSSNNEDQPFAGPTETTSALETTEPTEPTEPTASTEPEDQDAAAPVDNTDTADSGDGPVAGPDEPADEPDAEEPDEPAQEVGAPLTIEATIDTITPGGQCYAAGTIKVSGGTYPVEVHYQWRRLVLGGGWDGVAVTAVDNHTFTKAGEIKVQTDDLPDDGTNVFLVIKSPKGTGSGLVEYDGCNGPDVIIYPGD